MTPRQCPPRSPRRICIVGKVDVAVDQYAKVHISVGDIEYVQSYNQLMKNETMKSAASTLAHQIDRTSSAKVAKFSSYIGTGTFATDPSNNIGSPAEFNRVHTRLMDLGVPNSDLVSTVLFDDAEEIRGSLIGGNIDGVNRTALAEGKVPILSEIDIYATQQCPSLTVGTRVAGGDSLIDNGTLSVNYRDVKSTMVQTIHIDGQSSGVTIKVGETLTIAGVYAYDWRNQVALPYLQQFTVVGGASTASGAVAGHFGSRNGDHHRRGRRHRPHHLAADHRSEHFGRRFDGRQHRIRHLLGGCGRWCGRDPPGRCLLDPPRPRSVEQVRDHLVSAKLVTPFTGESSFATDPETGISIRYWRGSDISTGAHVHRWDCLFGAQNLDPLMGCQISGS
jgi:hypothetical protein